MKEPISSVTSYLIQSYGLIGVVVVVLLAALFLRDRQATRDRERLEGLLNEAKDETSAEKDARIADAKAYTELALKLQQQVIDTAQKMALIMEELRRGRRP